MELGRPRLERMARREISGIWPQSPESVQLGSAKPKLWPRCGFFDRLKSVCNLQHVWGSHLGFLIWPPVRCSAIF